MSTPEDQTAPTQDELNLEHYASRLDRPVMVKASEFKRGDRLRHVVFSGQFTPSMLSELAETHGVDGSDHPTLLRTDLEAGHGGASGRFKGWHDNARQDAFILWALGLETREA